MLRLLNEDLINLSKARIAHAEDCLREAQLLLDGDEYKGTANRAYYAAFHALRAVLILDEFDSKKHSGIIAKFRENYLKTELFNKDVSDYISSLFRVRTASDYDDFYIISKEESIEQLKKAEKIVEQIQEYLRTKY
ncbi:MAG: HEPN domain-containing protein [Clostridia bacterium]|nr:HEPN domain-containing protein [Clostridia bacterium]